MLDKKEDILYNSDKYLGVVRLYLDEKKLYAEFAHRCEKLNSFQEIWEPYARLYYTEDDNIYALELITNGTLERENSGYRRYAGYRRYGGSHFFNLKESTPSEVRIVLSTTDKEKRDKLQIEYSSVKKAKIALDAFTRLIEVNNIAVVGENTVLKTFSPPKVEKEKVKEEKIDKNHNRVILGALGKLK